MSGTKFDSNKPDLSLIPYCAEVAEAEALMIGEKKYGRYNFEDGHKASQLASAIKRHLGKWMNGEERDPDGQHHLGAIKANCSMLLRQIELNTLTDDRTSKKIEPLVKSEGNYMSVDRTDAFKQNWNIIQKVVPSPRFPVQADGTCSYVVNETAVSNPEQVLVNWDLHKVQDGYVDSEEPKLKVCKCEKKN